MLFKLITKLLTSYPLQKRVLYKLAESTKLWAGEGKAIQSSLLGLFEKVRREVNNKGGKTQHKKRARLHPVIQVYCSYISSSRIPYCQAGRVEDSPRYQILAERLWGRPRGPLLSFPDCHWQPHQYMSGSGCLGMRDKLFKGYRDGDSN